MLPCFFLVWSFLHILKVYSLPQSGASTVQFLRVWPKVKWWVCIVGNHLILAWELNYVVGHPQMRKCRENAEVVVIKIIKAIFMTTIPTNFLTLSYTKKSHKSHEKSWNHEKRQKTFTDGPDKKTQAVRPKPCGRRHYHYCHGSFSLTDRRKRRWRSSRAYPCSWEAAYKNGSHSGSYDLFWYSPLSLSTFLASILRFPKLTLQRSFLLEYVTALSFCPSIRTTRLRLSEKSMSQEAFYLSIPP